MVTNWRSRRAVGLAAMLAGVVASVSCGDVSRTGRAPAFLVIDSLTAASGAKPGEFGNVLLSDVVTLVQQTVGGIDTQVSTFYEDIGQVQVRVLLKDQGNPGATAGPSNLNWLKINRYRIVYRRADGRNTPGVDVPYPFDGSITATITNTPFTFGFTIVRIQAKREAPLMALRSGGGAVAISTIADVTFSGEDMVGNEFESTGSISINFADWADPQ